MAIIHHADLTPSKPATLAGWVPRQPWFAGDPAAPPEILGSPRLDDPGGEVGIETFLLRFGGGPVLQVPLTYRSTPLVGVEPVAVLEHSVLGRRFVHDGPTDPVYVCTTVAAMLDAGREAALIRGDEHLPSRGELRGVPAGPVRTPDLDPDRALTPQEAGGASTDATTEVAFPGGALRLWRHPRPLDAADGRPRPTSRPHLVGAGTTGPTRLLAELL